MGSIGSFDILVVFFFFKQKTAYEIYQCDWSSDVCSSDLSRDFNLAREAALDAGLSPGTPGTTMQIACGTSLQAALSLGAKIACGEIESGIAAGSDIISDSPVVFGDKFAHRLARLSRARSFGQKLSALKGFSFGELAPVAPSVAEPRTGLAMGQHCELMAREWGIGRKEQDAFALKSHQNASAAIAEGFHDDLIVPCAGIVKDNNVRADSSLEKMAEMKPAFDKRSGYGTLTAANSTPLTDGAAAVLVTSSGFAKTHGLTPLARVRAIAVAGCEPEMMGIGPVAATRKALARARLEIKDLDVIELNEAFAAQAIACVDDLGLPEDRINIDGGAIALGHPLGATGARITGKAAQLLQREGKCLALATQCIGGGQGIATILEAVS